MVGIVVTALGLCWLVVAVRSDNWTRLLAKPMASAGFLLIVAIEPLDSGTRSTLIVIGLGLGAIGDVALLGHGTRWFLTGLGSFLIGHVLYAVAFGFDQGSLVVRLAGVVGALLLALGVLRWLRPLLMSPFTVAVPFYIVVICLMVALAVGSGRAHPLAFAGAVLFAGSDLFVARERFVASTRLNPTLGLPLYYMGQVLIAASAVAW